MALIASQKENKAIIKRAIYGEINVWSPLGIIRLNQNQAYKKNHSI